MKLSIPFTQSNILTALDTGRRQFIATGQGHIVSLIIKAHAC